MTFQSPAMLLKQRNNLQMQLLQKESQSPVPEVFLLLWLSLFLSSSLLRQTTHGISVQPSPSPTLIPINIMNTIHSCLISSGSVKHTPFCKLPCSWISAPTRPQQGVWGSYSSLQSSLHLLAQSTTNSEAVKKATKVGEHSRTCNLSQGLLGSY